MDDFKIFIDRLKDRMDEDVGTEFSETVLMDKVENKYKILKNERLWKVRNSEENKILILEAKVSRLEKANREIRRDKNPGENRRRKSRERGIGTT